MKKATYKKDEENGIMYETKASVKRRLSELTGFMQSKIVLLEADMDGYQLGEKRYHYYSGVLFEVNGKEFWAALYKDEWGTSDLRHA